MIRVLRRGLRAAVARLAGALLALGHRRSGASAPGRVLVIRIDERVGNVLLTSPLLRALRTALPGAQIDVLVARSKQALLAEDLRAIPFEKKALFRRPWAFGRLLWALRRARYDVAIDASHWHHLSLSSALLLSWTGAPVRVAHARGSIAAFANRVAPPPAGPREVEAKLTLLEPLGARPPVAPPMETPLGTDPAARARARAWLAALGPGPWIGLAPGSRKLDHRVGLEVFAQLGQAAQAAGARAVVLWGPGEETLARDLADRCGAGIAPPTRLDELAALMRELAAVVANDTGPMHLAVACGAPTVALFVNSDPERWGHPGPPHVMIGVGERTPEEIGAEAQAALLGVLGRARA